MSSDKKREANRRNAKKSTGPKSAASKARTRFNALKYGIFAADHLLPGEDPQERQQLTEGYFAYFRPVGVPEISLVQKMIREEMRVIRATGAECSYLTRRPDGTNNGGQVTLTQPNDAQTIKLFEILEKRVALIGSREALAGVEHGEQPNDEPNENTLRDDLYAALLEGVAPAELGGRLTQLYERIERFERALERKMKSLMDLQAHRIKREV